MCSTDTVTRRSFLKLSFAILLLPFVSAPSRASSAETLTLRVVREGVPCQATFMQDGEIIGDEYYRICHVLKDLRADAAVQMDIELLKIVARAQEWLSRYGYTQPLIITSGYRTIETNMATEGASQMSMHMYGKAIDLKYPGLPIRYMATLFRSFGGTRDWVVSNVFTY